MAALDDDFVLVPDQEDMDDDTFLKHLDLRHSEDTGVEKSLHKQVHRQQAWIGTYRAFHEYIHRTKEFEDHEHEDNEW